MIWIVSLSHCLARIYTYQPLDRLTEIECVENPAGHLKESDLLTDRPGRYQTSHTARSAYEWPSDPQEVELGRFTHYVADRLKKGLNENQYTQLIICGTPHVSGVLLAQLDKQVKQVVLANLSKNFIDAASEDLMDYLKNNWWEIKSKKA